MKHTRVDCDGGRGPRLHQRPRTREHVLAIRSIFPQYEPNPRFHLRITHKTPRLGVIDLTNLSNDLLADLRLFYCKHPRTWGYSLVLSFGSER